MSNLVKNRRIGLNEQYAGKPLSLLQGVSYSQDVNRLRRWRAHAQVNGRQKTVGYFLTLESAAAARAEFLQRLPVVAPKPPATGLSYQPSKSSTKPWLAYAKQKIKGWKYISCFPTKDAAEKAQLAYYREQDCADLFNKEV